MPKESANYFTSKDLNYNRISRQNLIVQIESIYHKVDNTCFNFK